MILALALFAGSVALAQSPAEKKAHPTKEEEELIALEHQWCEAYKQRDTQTLARLLAEDFIFTDDEGQVYNKPQYLDVVLQQNVTAYTLEDIRTRQYGQTGIVNSRGEWKYTMNGNDASGEFRSTEVFVKQNGRWQAVAAQDTRIPKKKP
jgi:ketosteroid isomerase-like protein